MDLLATTVTAGVLGTLAMDALNLLFARAGLISRIEVRTIGRMAVGWSRGRFRYQHPGDMVTVSHEGILGICVHYSIGVALAVPYVLGWTILVGGPASPVWAIAYGLTTTVASWFLVYPSMGLGILGVRSPDGLKAPLSSLANHVFYGLGLAAALAL